MTRQSWRRIWNSWPGWPVGRNPLTTASAAGSASSLPPVRRERPLMPLTVLVAVVRGGTPADARGPSRPSRAAAWADH